MRLFFIQAEDGIRGRNGLEFRRVLFRSQRFVDAGAGENRTRSTPLGITSIRLARARWTLSRSATASELTRIRSEIGRASCRKESRFVGAAVAYRKKCCRLRVLVRSVGPE